MGRAPSLGALIVGRLRKNELPFLSNHCRPLCLLLGQCTVSGSTRLLDHRLINLLQDSVCHIVEEYKRDPHSNARYEAVPRLLNVSIARSLSVTEQCGVSRCLTSSRQGLVGSDESRAVQPARAGSRQHRRNSVFTSDRPPDTQILRHLQDSRAMSCTSVSSVRLRQHMSRSSA